MGSCLKQTNPQDLKAWWQVLIYHTSKMHMWNSENCAERVLSFHIYMGSRDWTHVLRLALQALLRSKPSCWPICTYSPVKCQFLFLKNKTKNIYHLFVYLYACEDRCLQKPEEVWDHLDLQLLVAVNCQVDTGNSGPPKEQQTSLTTDPSLQHLQEHFKERILMQT